MSPDPPGFRLATGELADWLDRQDPDCWWLVDGDPLLMGLVSFPTTGDVLAARLRKIDQPLLVLDDRDKSGSADLSADDLDRHVYLDEHDQERIFRLQWDTTPPGVEWLLIEDKESARLARSSDEDY
jgi:hypothetical protein